MRVLMTVQCCVALFASLTPLASARNLTDQPDDHPGLQQVHLLYVLPSDGTDRGLDTDGTLTTSFGIANQWLADQDGGKPFNLDTAGGVPDITFVQIGESDEQMGSYGVFIRDHLESQLRALGFSDRSKIYLTYYDGTAHNVCANSAWPGHLAALYLLGRFDRPGAVGCARNPFAKAGGP